MSKKSRQFADNRSRGSSIASRGNVSDNGSATDPGVWDQSDGGPDSGARFSEGSVGNRKGTKVIQDQFLMRNHYSKKQHRETLLKQSDPFNPGYRSRFNSKNSQASGSQASGSARNSSNEKRKYKPTISKKS